MPGYELWKAQGQKWKIGAASQHILIATNLEREKAIQMAESANRGSSDGVRYYYRKRYSCSYAVRVKQKSCSSDCKLECCTNNMFEVLYNDDDAIAAKKRYEAVHAQYNTGCVISIEEIDESAARDQCRLENSDSTYGDFIRGGALCNCPNCRAIPDLEDGGGADSDGGADNGGGADSDDDNGRETGQNSVAGIVLNALMQHPMMGLITSNYFIAVRTGTVDQYAESLGCPRILLDRLVIRYLVGRL